MLVIPIRKYHTTFVLPTAILSILELYINHTGTMLERLMISASREFKT